MKTKLALTILIAIAIASAAEIDFSAPAYQVVSVPYFGYPIGLNSYIIPDKTRDSLFWIGDGLFDSTAGSGCLSLNRDRTRWVDFDKNGDAWAASYDSGLVHRYISGAVKKYTIADGLPSISCYVVKFDSIGNRLIVGTKNGVSIVYLNASENPTRFDNFFSAKLIKNVEIHGQEIWAVASQNGYGNTAFYCDSSNSWTTYDSTNSTIRESFNYTAVYTAIDKDGNFYLPVYLGKAKSAIAKFNHSAKSWESIDMSAVNDSFAGISQIKIDKNNQLWCVFPIMRNNSATAPWYEGWLVKIDLATGTIEKSPTNSWSKYSWLHGTTYYDPLLGLTADGNIIIVASGGVMVFGKNSNAVLPRTIKYEVARDNYRFLGQFDPLGRMLSPNFSIKNSASGMRLFFYQSSTGSKAVKVPTVK